MKKAQGRKNEKSLAAEIDRRCTEVCEWILVGCTRHEILQNAAKWRLKTRQLDEYIARAKEKIMEENTSQITETVAMISKNLWRIYRMALSVGDIAEANKALMNLAKVKGVGTINIHATIEDFSAYADETDSNLERRLLEAKNGG